MPITFHPSPSLELAPVHQSSTSDPRAVLNGALQQDVQDSCTEILQSSFGQQSIVPNSNGFVLAAITANSCRNHLILRPDDVWISILTQLSFYVNAHAKNLRHLFVLHQGKKKLELQAIGFGHRYTVDVGDLAEQSASLTGKNVVDPELKDWIIPDFTTTTANDRVVASVVMMATTTKKHFECDGLVGCGLPVVTLMGEKADWNKLLARLKKLPSFGKDTAHWCTLLKPVLRRFVSTFDKPDSKSTVDFWQNMAQYENKLSSEGYLAGWITAFCYFSEMGEVLYKTPESEKALTLDGVTFHRVNLDSIPQGYAQVDVELNDNGQKFETSMVAGMIGMQVSDSGLAAGKHDGKNDTLQPVAGWWFFEKQPVPEEDQYGDENRWVDRRRKRVRFNL